MLLMTNEDLNKSSILTCETLTNGTNLSFDLFKFHSKILPKLHEEANIQYPITIKTPKSLPELLRGDYTPKQVIEIKEPLVNSEGLPMWFGNSVKGVSLRPGYINGDSRSISDIGLRGTYVHGMFGGATGQGKSVMLLTMITTLLMEYSPWAVRLVLCDPKLSELKPYALSEYTPHIRTVGATEDMDYVISVLADMVNEMNTVNQILVKTGVQNIWDFYEKTGLMLPRNILVCDEFETLLSKAGKKLNKLLSCIEALNKLGRSTGYHLIFASQNVPDELPTAVKNNIAIRACLGAKPNVSKVLIGNEAAKDYTGLPGRLIFNPFPDNESTKDNVHIVIPYVGAKHRIKVSEDCRQSAKKVNYTANLSFYDETSFIYSSEVKSKIESFNFEEPSLFIGEPSYVSYDKYGILRLSLTGRNIENIAINAPSIIEHCRILTPMIESFSKWNQAHLVVSLDPEYEETLNLGVMNPLIVSDDDLPIRNDAFNMAYLTYINRSLALLIEKQVYNFDGEYTPEEEETYNSIINSIQLSGEVPAENLVHLKSDLNKKRFLVGLRNLQYDQYILTVLGLNGGTSSEIKKEIISYLGGYLIWMSIKKYGLHSFSRDDLDYLNLWILGINNFKGVGKPAGNKRAFNQVASILSDSKSCKLRIIYTVSNSEPITDYHKDVRWCIFSGSPNSEVSRIKATDFYPETIAPIQAVLFDVLEPVDKCVKFKKIKFDGEL